MLETKPVEPADILVYGKNGVARLPHSEFNFAKGDKVSAITSFYGGRQKAIVVDGPFFDRILSQTFYQVRITSKTQIYGGYYRGEIVNITNRCLSKR